MFCDWLRNSQSDGEAGKFNLSDRNSPDFTAKSAPSLTWEGPSVVIDGSMHSQLSLFASLSLVEFTEVEDD
jgi:hypothetical protein